MIIVATEEKVVFFNGEDLGGDNYGEVGSLMSTGTEELLI